MPLKALRWKTSASGPSSLEVPRISSSAMAMGLYARAQRLAGKLGHPPLRSVAVGGGSDGNFTAGVGTPTLDGLGTVGGGSHARTEHALQIWIPRRIELTAALVSELLSKR